MVALGWLLALKTAHLRLRPKNLLHMMPQLMRHHIRLRELAGATAKPRQLIPEAQVDVHLLVGWTVKRSRRRLSRPASRLRIAAKEDQLRMAIVPARLLWQNRRPLLLHIVEHKRDKLRRAVLSRRGCP